MTHPALLVLLLAALGLAACGERREPPPVDETVFRDQVRALDKARSVEDEVEKRKRELDRQLDRDTNGD
jgi:hypothetical protein